MKRVHEPQAMPTQHDVRGSAEPTIALQAVDTYEYDEDAGASAVRAEQRAVPLGDAAPGTEGQGKGKSRAIKGIGHRPLPGPDWPYQLLH